MPNCSFVRQSSYSTAVSKGVQQQHQQHQHQKTVTNLNDHTIFVAELEPQVTDKDLLSLFKQYGLITKISKQPNTTYAYITFERLDVARDVVKKAVFKLNDRTIRVMPYNQPEIFDENANLIIKNLESYIDELDLLKRFKYFGEIFSCKVARYENGQSKCFAYIQFKNVKSARMAIDQMNNTYWDDNYDPDKQYKMFKMTNNNRQRFFPANPVVNMSFTSSSTSSLAASPNSPDETQLVKGKKLYVGVFKKKDIYYKLKNDKVGLKSNLYVKNLGQDFGDRDLYNLFKKYGSIKSVKIRRVKNSNKPLGCGFVDFEEPGDAERARIGLDGFILNDHGVNRVLSVKYANCKTRRERYAEMQSLMCGGNNTQDSLATSGDIMSSSCSNNEDDINNLNNHNSNNKNTLIAINFNLEQWQTTQHKLEWYDRWQSSWNEYRLF